MEEKKWRFELNSDADQQTERHDVADDDKRWQDMSPDEQAVVIRQISGAVNGLQFRVQDLEDAVKALQERLDKPTP